MGCVQDRGWVPVTEGGRELEGVPTSWRDRCVVVNDGPVGGLVLARDNADVESCSSWIDS